MSRLAADLDAVLRHIDAALEANDVSHRIVIRSELEIAKRYLHWAKKMVPLPVWIVVCECGQFIRPKPGEPGDENGQVTHGLCDKCAVAKGLELDAKTDAQGEAREGEAA